MVDYEYLYRYDVHGNIRFWRAQRKGNAYRSVTGVVNGAHVESDWRYAEPKNVGRSNATTAEEQAHAEIDANYRKRLELGWSYDPATSGANFIKPMLAAKYEDEKHRIDPDTIVYLQPKLDGIRCVISEAGMFTRNGKPIVSCAHIWYRLKNLFDLHPDLVLDGELYNHELKNNFNAITSMVRRQRMSEEELVICQSLVQYHVYDGWVDPGKRFAERRRDVLTLLLTQNAMPDGGPVVPVETVQFTHSGIDADNLYEKWLADGYEGMMVRLDTPYENKRTRALLKRKPDETAEFPVVRVEEGVGNWSGKVKRFVIRLSDGSEQGAGVRGNMSSLMDLVTQSCPDWATVKYQNITPDGKLRFPVVVDYGWSRRED